MSGTPVPEDASTEPSATEDFAQQSTQGGASGDPSTSDTADISSLDERLSKALTQLDSAKDAQLRTIAEMDNLRKRMEREIVNAGKYSSEKILSELVGVADSLDLGLAAALQPEAQISNLIEGMQLTFKQLQTTLEKHGVKAVDPSGELFNPDLHEAMAMVPSAEVAPNHVVQVMQKGYRLHDRLLRPAMVVVAKALDNAS